MCSQRRTLPPDPFAVPETVHDLRERLAEVLHDLHSPLAALSLLALPEGASSAPGDDGRYQLRRAVTSLRRQIFVLRDHPLFRTVPMVLVTARHDLDPWLGDLQALLAELARGRGIDLEWCPHREGGTFAFDASRMAVAVEHLFMQRARRSCRPGKVRVRCEWDANHLEIGVAGLDASEAPDPMAFPARFPAGVEFAAAVVEAHDGFLVELDAQDGFKEWVARIPGPLGGDSSFADHDSDAEGPLRRVLVVEDDGALRELLVDLLSIRFRVDSSHDGAGAMRCAAENPPDLLVVDQGLPDSTGMDLARSIRALAGRDVPLLLVTGAVESADIPELERMRILLKPFRGTDLISQSVELLRSGG
jgi:CheY-like chemotaxis protein